MTKLHKEIIRIVDLPGSLVDSVWDHISRFTVGMDRINLEKNIIQRQLIGSGTLVLINRRHCILTADHVLSDTGLRTADQLALLTSFSGKIQRYSLDRRYFGIHTLARGRDESTGPDIGLIVLPEALIGHLKSEKIFFNLDRRKDRFKEGFIGKEMGAWFTTGIIEETEKDLGSKPGFDSIKGYKALCGISGVTKEYMDSSFDYLEMNVDYQTGIGDLPLHFGGCSGGGVWQVLLQKNDQGLVIPEEYVLSGIVFYQSGTENSQRVLRCHGRNSIYVNVPKLLTNFGS